MDTPLKPSPPPFALYFETEFLDAYELLSPVDRKRVDKAVALLAANPRHPSLRTHVFRGRLGKYPTGEASSLYIAYASQGKGALRIIFEYSPEAGEIALHTCGPRDRAER